MLVPVIDPVDGCGNADAMLIAAGLSRPEVKDMMWPAHMYLDADPGGSFAMKRDHFRYIVRNGKLRTVSPGALAHHYHSVAVANQVMGNEAGGLPHVQHRI